MSRRLFVSLSAVAALGAASFSNTIAVVAYFG